MMIACRICNYLSIFTNCNLYNILKLIETITKLLAVYLIIYIINRTAVLIPKHLLLTNTIS